MSPERNITQGGPAATTDRPSHAATLLRAIRALIQVGLQRLHIVQAQPEAAETRSLAGAFGTFSLAVILARITRGLRLATALEDRVIRTARRIDALGTAPIRQPRSAPSRSAPREPALSDAADNAALLAHMPTEQEIAAMVRRRPIGAVLADICRDLGVGTDHPLWRDLQGLIPIHNGQVAPIVLRTVRRIFDAHQEARQLALPPYDAPPAVAATGPPPQRQAA